MRVQVITPIQGNQLKLIPGDVITSLSGNATVTRTEIAGLEQIIWADYGSGIEQPHVQESLLSTEQPPKCQRRHSAKGKAVGWIEERQGNLKRKKPSTSYYYCWQEGDRRGKTYVPVRQMAAIRAMVDSRCSVDEILAAITKRSTPHHTDTPKI
jgi:hypothetical protein